MLGLAAAYFLAGQLAYLLKSSFGYASLNWPPAGIALAGILIYGYRAWPGILLGAFLINGLNPTTASFFSGNLSSLLVTLIISSGASLQALAGAYLVKRYAGFPNALNQLREIVLFFVFGGLLSALINSTVSMTTLVSFGLVPSAAFLDQWGSWYLGDVFGIVIFSPLILVWLQSTKSGWRSRRWGITFPVLLMFILTSAIAFYELVSNNQRIKLRFDQHAQELQVDLENSIQRHINVLRSLESFYAASEHVDGSKFQRYTMPVLKDIQGIQALEWAPIIQASEREAFEKRFQQNGQPRFQITEQDINKNMQRAKERSYYVPITFLEPYLGNEKAWGYDFASSPERLAALTRAADTGELSLTSRVTLVQEQGTQQGLVAYQPLYHGDLPLQTQEQRRNAISGYIVGIFRIGDMVMAAFQHKQTDGLIYRLIDQSSPAAEQLLFTSASDQFQPTILQRKTFFTDSIVLLHTSNLSIGGRFWRFEIAASPTYVTTHSEDYMRFILIACLLLTSFVIGFCLLSSGREHLLEILVHERSTEITLLHEQTTALENQALLAKIFHNIPGMVFQFKLFPDGHASLPLVSEGIGDLYELSADQVGEDASTLFARIHPDDYNQVVASLQESARSEQPLQLEYRVLLPEKGLRWLSGLSRPEKFDDGSTVWYGFQSDITERKFAQKLAYETGEHLRLVLTAATGISVITTDVNGLITIFNPGAEQMLGYVATDMIGKQVPALFHLPEEVEQRGLELTLELGWPVSGFSIFVEKSLETGQEIREWTYVCKNGSRLLVSLCVTPIRNANHELEGFLGIATDISESKEYQDSIMLAKEQAEHFLQLKSQFIASMSHEIRTPMAAVIGFSQLALINEMPDKIRLYLENINIASTSLLSILNDILDFSKLEVGRTIIEQQPFQLNALLDTLDKIFSISAQQQGLKFNLVLASNIPNNLIGDKLRLQQVLTNLLGNAIKFTTQGSVSLNITLQQIDLTQVRLLFCVTDTGIGISAEDQKKLFQPFSQVDGSITRRFGGTGLGLAISHKLMELMGSEFSLISNPELGSSFSFELVLGLSTSTISRQSHFETQGLVTIDQNLSGTRVLVVEDNLLIQQVVRGFLDPSGIIVTIANDGQEALVLLEQNEFDGVLMDIHMPIMNGFEATKQIRRLPQFAHLPVIALTAGVTVEEREQCLATGMNDFIPKPIDSKQLLMTLTQWLKPLS